MSSLQHLFHTHEPPDLITTLPRTNPSLSQSRTRAPRGSTGELFDAIPDSTLHVRHDVAILANLEQLLNESWTDEARSNPVGESWDVFFEMVKDVAAHYTIRNEVNDLGGVFAHQLFTPVNLVASRGQNKLRPQAYPHNDMRSAFSPSVSHLKAGADHYATLSAPPESLVRSENRIAVEKKLPTSVTTRGMMGGVIQAATEQGFRIRKGRDDDGNDQYCSIDTVETSFIDALTQTVEYMDTSMCKLGLLTNYDVFIVILRLSSDTVTLSSPVIRKEISRNSLPANLANDTSVFDLLLALLLFTGKPQRLDAINSGLWVGLYVRKPNEDRPTHTKRKGREKESGNKKRKTGEGEGGPSGFEDGRGDSGANDHDHGGEKLLEGGYQMERRRERPRRSDESGLSLGDTSIPSLRDPDTSSFTQGSNEDQKIITPTSATFDLNLNQSSSLFSGEPSSFLSDPKSGTNTRFGPVLHLDYQPSGRPLAVEDVEFLTSTEWYPVIPSTLAEEERVVIDRLITHGEYFKTFSARSSSDQDSLIAHSYSTDHPLSSRSTASDVSMTSHPTANDHPLPSPFLSSHQLIIKLAYLRHPRHHEELHLASGPEIAQAAEAECRILSGPLRDLQGERVPRLSGMWRSRDGIWGLTILGKVDGRQLGEGEALEEGEFQAILEAYRILHRRKVIHGDVEPRHVFLGENGMVRLIDFDRARQEVGEREVERERREVKRVFGRSVRKRS